MTVVEDNKNFDDTYIDVDDFLWLVMHQWAVLMETYLKTAQDKLNYLIRHDEQSQTSHANNRSHLLRKYANVMESIYAKKNSDIISPGNITIDLAYGCQLCSKSDIVNDFGHS